MIITKNQETNMFVATQTSLATDGVTRFSLEAYGETASEAINKCLLKCFGTGKRLDVKCVCEPNETDDDSNLLEADMSNVEPGFNPDNF